MRQAIHVVFWAVVTLPELWREEEGWSDEEESHEEDVLLRTEKDVVDWFHRETRVGLVQ